MFERIILAVVHCGFTDESLTCVGKPAVFSSWPRASPSYNSLHDCHLPLLGQQGTNRNFLYIQIIKRPLSSIAFLAILISSGILTVSPHNPESKG